MTQLLPVLMDLKFGFVSLTMCQLVIGLSHIQDCLFTDSSELQIQKLV